MKARVGAFNQEKALVGAFSVIVQLCRLIVYSTRTNASLEYAQVQPGPAGSNHLICQISHDNASLQERSQVLVCTAFTSVCDSTLHFAYLHWRQHVDGDFAQTGTDLLG